MHLVNKFQLLVSCLISVDTHKVIVIRKPETRLINGMIGDM